MTYERKLFDPGATAHFEDSVYIYTDEIVLTVNVALAVGRPLLVRGPSGCGKSTLARNVAQVLGVPYYEHVVSSRTHARDLLWRVDLLRRFHDAQIPGKDLRSMESYIEPGILWWAIDPESARRGAAGREAERPASAAGDRPAPQRERKKRSSPRRGLAGAVVLVDEIDKADPDVPNDLLHVFETLQFVVEDTGFVVRSQTLPLVIVTSNDERELPFAFTRRCLELTLQLPDAERLVRIGEAHFPSADMALLSELAAIVVDRAQYSLDAAMPPPSTAEYLDAIKACLELGISPRSREFELVAASTALKPRRAAEDF